ncbi:hypothetical protein VNO77_02711 [Canavalia gladiata]|uniref:Uncharacterized protein n=1 Tax=Canavalia gladiata TaxID=3824 RepID=A0AAN9MU51_CANGL
MEQTRLGGAAGLPCARTIDPCFRFHGNHVLLLCFGQGVARASAEHDYDLSMNLHALVQVYAKPSAIVSFARFCGDLRELHHPALVRRRGGSLCYSFEPGLEWGVLCSILEQSLLQ